MLYKVVHSKVFSSSPPSSSVPDPTTNQACGSRATVEKNGEPLGSNQYTWLKNRVRMLVYLALEKRFLPTVKGT